MSKTKEKLIIYIKKAVDMNNDNKITITDVSQLKLLLVGMMPPEGRSGHI